MAMALKSKNRHYSWDKIQMRHWLTMADYCQFPREMMNRIIEEVCDDMENVIAAVSAKIPIDFPTNISDPIFAGMRKIKHCCR